jgi:hypothetical protein
MIPALPAQGYIVGVEAAMIKSVAETVIDLDEFIANGFPPGAGAISIAQASLPLSSQQTAPSIAVSTTIPDGGSAPNVPPPMSASPVRGGATPVHEGGVVQAATAPDGQQEPVVAEASDWGW